MSERQINRLFPKRGGRFKIAAVARGGAGASHFPRGADSSRTSSGPRTDALCPALRPSALFVAMLGVLGALLLLACRIQGGSAKEETPWPSAARELAGRRPERSLFPHSGVRICPQESLGEVLASHRAYYQLRVCQEAVWEAYRIFLDRIPGTAEYQRWLHTCQRESLRIADIAGNFSRSEEHLDVIQWRMTRLRKQRPPPPPPPPPPPSRGFATPDAPAPDWAGGKVVGGSASGFPACDAHLSAPPEMSEFSTAATTITSTPSATPTRELEADSDIPNVVPEGPAERKVDFSIDLVDPGYRELLDDLDSPQYVDLAHHLRDQMRHVFDRLPGFLSIRVGRISETQEADSAGGITVHYSLVFESSAPPGQAEAAAAAAESELRETVRKALREEASLPVDLDSLKFEPEALPRPPTEADPEVDPEADTQAGQGDSHNEFGLLPEEAEEEAAAAEEESLGPPSALPPSENALVTLLDPSERDRPKSEPSGQEELLVSHQIESFRGTQTGQLLRDFAPASLTQSPSVAASQDRRVATTGGAPPTPSGPGGHLQLLESETLATTAEGHSLAGADAPTQDALALSAARPASTEPRPEVVLRVLERTTTAAAAAAAAIPDGAHVPDGETPPSLLEEAPSVTWEEKSPELAEGQTSADVTKELLAPRVQEGHLEEGSPGASAEATLPTADGEEWAALPEDPAEEAGPAPPGSPPGGPTAAGGEENLMEVLQTVAPLVEPVEEDPLPAVVAVAAVAVTPAHSSTLETSRPSEGEEQVRSTNPADEEDTSEAGGEDPSVQSPGDERETPPPPPPPPPTAGTGPTVYLGLFEVAQSVVVIAEEMKDETSGAGAGEEAPAGDSEEAQTTDLLEEEQTGDMLEEEEETTDRLEEPPAEDSYGEAQTGHPLEEAPAGDSEARMTDLLEEAQTGDMLEEEQTGDMLEEAHTTDLLEEPPAGDSYEEEQTTDRLEESPAGDSYEEVQTTDLLEEAQTGDPLEEPEDGSSLWSERTSGGVDVPYPGTPTTSTVAAAAAAAAVHGGELVVFFSLRVTNLDFSENLFNKTSPEYKSLESTLRDVLLPYLRANLTGFRELEILNFRKGSVVVNSRMKLAQSTACNVTQAVQWVLRDFCSFAAADHDPRIRIDSRSLDVESADRGDPCKFLSCGSGSRCVLEPDGSAGCRCRPGFLSPSADGLPCRSVCQMRPGRCGRHAECRVEPGRGASCRSRSVRRRSAA
ncbi:interphotoreceptor matrix proteoglycan 1-like isoform X2 [Stigmatopora nigra]